MKGKNIKIIKGLIKLHGEQWVIDKAIEEILELATALSHYKSPTKPNKEVQGKKVEDEMADVKYSFRMLEMVFNRSNVNKIMNRKLEKKEKKYLLPK